MIIYKKDSVEFSYQEMELKKWRIFRILGIILADTLKVLAKKRNQNANNWQKIATERHKNVQHQLASWPFGTARIPTTSSSTSNRQSTVTFIQFKQSHSVHHATSTSNEFGETLSTDVVETKQNPLESTRNYAFYHYLHIKSSLRLINSRRNKKMQNRDPEKYSNSLIPRNEKRFDIKQNGKKSKWISIESLKFKSQQKYFPFVILRFDNFFPSPLQNQNETKRELFFAAFSE